MARLEGSKTRPLVYDVVIIGAGQSAPWGPVTKVQERIDRAKQVCTEYKQRATIWIYIQMRDCVFWNLITLLGELGALVCV